MKTLLAFILLLVTSVSVQAQQQNTIWHWAWNQDTGELFAYSPTGTVNLLTDELNTIYQFGDIWRVNETQAIALATIDEMQTLYLLDSVSAQPVELMFDEATWQTFLEQDYLLGIKAYHYPHVVIGTQYVTDNRLFTTHAFLLDLSTHQFHLLSETASATLRFSEDGDYLRYAISAEENNTVTIDIKQHELSTGQETILYSYVYNLQDRFVQIRDANTHGTEWLIHDRNADLDEWDEYSLLFSLDTMDTEQIYERDSEWGYQRFDFVYDDLFSYEPICIEDCVATIITTDGETLNYPTGDIIRSSVYTTYRTPSNGLVVQQLYDFTHFDTEGNYERLGFLYRGGSHLPSNLSPDGRYALLADTDVYPPTDRWMMDFLTGERLFDIPDALPNPLAMTYQQDGFLITSRDNDNAIMFRYGDDTYTELPSLSDSQMEYFAMLPDDKVLFTDYRQIINYDPATGEQTVIIEDISRIRDIHVELIIQNIFSS